MAKHAHGQKGRLLHVVSHQTGATRADAWPRHRGWYWHRVQLRQYWVTRELPNDTVIMLEGRYGAALRLMARFVGRHILSPKPGVAVHINAYNFPLLGACSKRVAPSSRRWRAGHHQARHTPAAYLTEGDRARR